MEHLKIWIQIGALIVGSGVLFDTYQMHSKYRQLFLKPMWWCYLLLNLSFLVGAFNRYLYYNFFGSADLFKTSLYWDVIDPLSGLLIVGLTYFLIALDRSYLKQRVPGWLKWLAACCLAFIVVRTVLGQVADRPSAMFDAAENANRAIMVVAFFTAMFILGRFAFGRHSLEGRSRVKAIRQLGLFYLVGCVLIFLSAAFFGPAHDFVYASICLLLNLFPFYWYRRHLPHFHNAIPPGLSDGDVSGFCEKFGVSPRQQEIVELLLCGKSNREIAETLYIAPHTVKNHIYSVYQKLGVKSRFELVSTFLNHTRQ